MIHIDARLFWFSISIDGLTDCIHGDFDFQLAEGHLNIYGPIGLSVGYDSRKPLNRIRIGDFLLSKEGLFRYVKKSPSKSFAFPWMPVISFACGKNAANLTASEALKKNMEKGS